MKYDIYAQNIKITKSIREYLEEKISKLDKYFASEDIKARVLLKVIKNDQIIEVTIPTIHFLIRAEETNHNLYNAIDLVIDKIEGQIRKNKTRIKSKMKKEKANYINLEFEEEDNKNEKVVKIKRIEMKPMDVEEAILEMNLLGHNFFMFKNRDNNKMCVLYKRKDNNYGIIEEA
ncbi:MAG: ribosome-associated translation inhibitor RaiA [Bacilli bacterium]